MNYIEPQVYLKKVYESWLGKIIGVRLGSPVENWSHEKIMDTYGDKKGYLVDYDVYASDDDINGPLFFVRALLDYDEINAEVIGKTFLNYICEYSGFFWWGGVGVSSEHTAYENLKNGIKAPESGSIKQNGLTIAEQIGGQIFSDCWGYVSLGDPEMAKKLSQMASSVTHDGNGIEGGVFVAVSIALAMNENDIHTVIDKALEYLDKDKEYYKVAKDIINFYHNNPDDWHKCLKYIQDNYGYDKYPGVCHIIPNMALMIMAMSYGDNDFDKTLIMLNQSGWDTDCNCGNVGSIMGALLGLERINESWIRPINDLINASSCIGCLNIQTVSDSAYLFTKLAYKLRGIEIEDFGKFNLPYSNKGIRCDNGEITVKDNLLYINSNDIYFYPYYLKENLFDARYDPQFSAIIEPGNSIMVELNNNDNNFEYYVLDCKGNRYSDECEVIDNRIKIDIPIGKNMVVNRIGLLSDKPYQIKDINVIRNVKLEYDFNDYDYEHLGPRYEGDDMNNIRNFVIHSGNWTLDNGLVGKTSEHGLISTGNYGSRYKSIEYEFEIVEGKEHCLVFSMKGYLDFYRVGIRNNKLVLIRKKDSEKEIRSYDIDIDKGNHTLKIVDNDNNTVVYLDNKEYEFDYVELNNLIGVYLGKDCINITKGLKAE